MYSEDEFVEDEYTYGQEGYGGQYDRMEHMVPDKVKKVMAYMQDMIADRNINELNTLYETSIPELTEQYYKSCEWPEYAEIAPYVREDPVFQNLYKELYYRHLYARVPGSLHLDQRLESYWNYCELFNYIISAETPVALELPNQWLWEIIDEFIYQFQSFSQYRAKTAKKTEAELDNLKRNNTAWNVHSILNVLHHLVEKSNINKQLDVYNSQGNSEQIQDVAGEFGRHSLYKMLGYFSLVGLLRLHSLLGDYYQAIKVLENIELNKNSQHSKVPGCQITISYYVGFAYMMMRRYADAIRTFSNSLLYIQKTKQNFQAKSYQNDQINKQTDQMYMLLSISLVLHPQRIDESLQTTLREKQYADKMNKMQRGEMHEFESCFMTACPKFVNPVAPPVDSAEAHLEPARLQLQVFMEEVKQQQMLPTIRSYLKLYTTMPLDKMAGFMDMAPEEFRNHLLTFKHKMQNVVWTKGTSGLEGEFQSGSEVDFYIDRNMIHIADTKVARRYGDFFIRQIHKFSELNRNLRDE